jgi:ATP-dependent helicase/nuclease subunit A
MHSEPGALADASERRIATDPATSVLVQAPAGSGKTTLLTQRVLRLLPRVAAPERILALTFTRKAAQEMRSRVIGAIEASLADECPADMDPSTWALARSARRWLDDNEIDLVRNPARLRIETIDGFYAWIAAQLPVTAGAGGRFTIAADPQRLYEEAAERALAQDDDPAFAAVIDHALELNDERWSAVRDLVASMLPGRESWLPVLAGHLQATSAFVPGQEDRVRRALDEDLSLLIERSLRRAYDSLGAERIGALSELLGAAAERIEAGSETLSAWRASRDPLQPSASDVARWRDLAQLLLTEKDAARKAVNKQLGFGPDCDATSKARIKDLLEEFARTDAAIFAFSAVKMLPRAGYDDAHWERVKAISRLLILSAAELDQVFRQRGECDFGAVAIAAMRALGSAQNPTDLGLALDYRIDHILVDEFQDTSNAQLELFKLMTGGWQPGDGRTFFCVGDPMQSIYGFREAEVRAFLELAQEGLGGVPLDSVRLSSNFRAQRPIVEWVNSTFSRVFPRVDDRERGAIAYSPAHAMARDVSISDRGLKTQLFATASDEAAHIARGIQERLGRHPDSRVAILVRTKKLAAEIASALRALNLPFRAADIVRLQDRAVVSDIILLARALTHFSDRTAWFGLLRSPCVGMELADLWLLARAAPTIWQGLADPVVRSRLSAAGAARAARVHGVLNSAFEMRDQSGFSRWVERTWIALGGPAAGLTELDVGSARAAFARLNELDDQGMPDPSQLDAAFDRLFAAEQGEHAIEIMTIHKAKGLEFDLVVVPRLDHQGRPNEGEFLRQYQFSREDRMGIVLAARAARGGDADPLFEFLRWADKDSSRLEAERLLYVACTRAKQELWLTGVAQARSAAKPKEFAPTSGSLLSVLWPICKMEFERIDVAPDPVPAVAAQAAQSRLPADWRPIALDRESLAEAALLPAPRPPGETTPPFDWASETARQIGVLVHEQLQRLQLTDDMAEEIRSRMPAYERWFEARGVPKQQIKAAARRVVDALSAIGEDARGRWILNGGYANDARELGLSSVLDGRIVRVILDRTFVHDGVRWVIDYKTSEHTGGERESFLDNEVQRYSAQMQRYAQIASKLGPEPVRLGLYFPLMRAWREWPAL